MNDDTSNFSHFIDGLRYMNMSAQPAADGLRRLSTAIEDMRLAGNKVTGVWIDEAVDITASHQRATEAAQLRHQQTQSELEALPGFGSF